MKRFVQVLGVPFGLAVLLASLAVGASAPAPPRWVAALYVEAQQAVGLRWHPVPGATGYKVLRSTVKGKDHKEIATLAEAQYFDKDVESGTTYYYVLRAVAGNEIGPLSDEKVVGIPGMKKLLDVVGNERQARQAGARAEADDARRDSLSSSDWAFREPAPAEQKVADRVDSSLKIEEPRVQADFNKSPGSAPAAAASAPAAVAPERPAQLMAARGEDIPIKEAPSVAVPPAPEAKKMLRAVAPMGSPYPQHPGQPMSGPSYASFGEPFDEVWVISRPERPVPPAPGDYVPGCGELRVERDGKRLPFPLEHTEVAAKVAGYVATVRVSQKYRNPFDTKIEAVYVFPLPENAAVSDFVMTIGERRIRGIVREREEAERIYHDARQQGYQAALLTQERPNIFTQRVANIEPGKAIQVDIVYFNTLAYHDGAFSFVFPMVVGPRYNPAGSTGGVGAVPRGYAGASGQATEVQYLKPGERTGNDIGLTVEIDAGMPIERLESPSHVIDASGRGDEQAIVRLRRSDTIPNKDFVLNFRLAGERPRQALFLQRDGSEGWFTLLLTPPVDLEHLTRPPLEMVFLVDTSGSMNGWPIEKAKAALRRAVKSLSPGDTFQIIRFSGDNSRFRRAPVAATPENIAAGLAYLDGLHGAGGTEMVQGIRAALDFPRDPRRFRIVSFMTDGFVGNDAEVLSVAAESLGDARIFSFGVGTSVNRYLMEGLARVGRGAVAYIVAGDSDTEAVDRFYERISRPALTDISVDWGGMQVADVYPERIPDLFVGRPVILTGRFTGKGKTTIAVAGNYGGERVTQKLKVKLDKAGEHEGISKIWARARIADLGDERLRADAVRQADIRGDIIATALAHGLVSDYTAFVAVDATRVTAGDHGVTVVQPVPVPEGVRYDTTVTP